METQQRIVCQWCQSQNLTVATTCGHCGAPLDLRNVINVSIPSAVPNSVAASILLEYRSAGIARDMGWTTVATFQYCGQLHAARALLSRANIVSRIGPALEGSPEFDLETPSAEAARVREILGQRTGVSRT